MRGLSRILSLTVLLALPFSSVYAASAYVHDLKGTLTAAVGAGPARPLKMGDTFDAGVTLATGKDSVAVVKFEDGQVVTLSPETRFAVREYSYNKRSVRDSNMVFALLQGGLRFVTGVIGSTNRNAFKLNVGTATIGVRGTDGWASYVEGVILAAVNQGALSFTNPEGTAVIPVRSSAIINTRAGPGLGAAFVAPTNQMAAALATQTGLQTLVSTFQSVTAVQTQMSNVQIPINTPVIVAAAAQAAQVVATARAAQAVAASAANAVAAAQTPEARAAAEAAQQAANQAAAQATALATAAIATAQAAAVQALNAAVSAGATLPAAPPPTPTAAPLSAVVPTLTPAQIQAQTTLLQTSVQTQTTSLQTTQQTLNLPVTPTATIQNATPPPQPAPQTQTPTGQQQIQVIIPPPPTITAPVTTTTSAGTTTTAPATTTTTAPATTTTTATTSAMVLG